MNRIVCTFLFLTFALSLSAQPLSSIQVLAPNGGEWWQSGKTPTIYWKSENVEQIILEYSIDNGAHWIWITTLSATAQKYPWTVPATPSDQCLLRIRTNEGGDQSDAAFTISDQHLECPIVILGSSTAEGAGASRPDSAWVNRFRHALFQRNTRFSVVNLAKGGYTTYHILPTGTPSTPGVNIAVDQQRNVTKALTFQPYAIIINMPSNDAANNFGVNAQLNNFGIITSTAAAAGVQSWVCTTQPRNFSNPAQVQIQRAVKDSILAIYGDYALNFWDVLADANGFILSAFNAGDGVHLNNAGHRAIWQIAMAERFDTLNCALSNLYEPRQTAEKAIFKAYPNPFSDKLTFEFESFSGGHIRLLFTDTSGAVIDSVESDIQSAGIQTIRYTVPATMKTLGPINVYGEINDRLGFRRGAVKLMRM